MKNFSGVCQAAGADKPLRAFFIWITNIVTLSVPSSSNKKKNRYPNLPNVGSKRFFVHIIFPATSEGLVRQMYSFSVLPFLDRLLMLFHSPLRHASEGDFL